MVQRASRQLGQAGALERAKIWAEMRHREQQHERARLRAEEERQQRERSSGDGIPVMRWVLAGLVVLVVLGGIGYGAWFVFFGERDFKVTAEEVWKEFDADAAAANKKYATKFVQVRGKLVEQDVKNLDGKTVLGPGGKPQKQLVFEAPSGAKWRIVPPRSNRTRRSNSRTRRSPSAGASRSGPPTPTGRSICG